MLSISLWIKKPTLDGYRTALNNFGGSINILQAMLNTYRCASLHREFGEKSAFLVELAKELLVRRS